MPQENPSPPVVPRRYLLAFILLTTCFAAWGLANNMTDTLVAAFQKILDLSNLQSAFVQSAFYGAYFCLAIPAALLVRRFSYKAGIITGLSLFILGALLFYPASRMMEYWPFLLAIYILASGLSFLETTANPFVLALGDEKTATRRLNLAQAFNPLGSILGVVLAKVIILGGLDETTQEERALMNPVELETLRMQELQAVMTPYLGVACVLAVLLLLFWRTRIPHLRDEEAIPPIGRTVRRLWLNRRYLFGVVAQFFYVGAQICVWTYTIHYTRANLGIGGEEAGAWLLASIIVFSASRFVTTYLMTFFAPVRMLAVAAGLGVFLVFVVITAGGLLGSLALVGVSAVMSLMFPTIYGIALRGLGPDSKLAAAGLIMAIVGGALLTPLQGAILDGATVAFSYLVPAICFLVVGAYALWVRREAEE